ncbi:hypothetical protein ZOSMA_252G00060 [Zostera marina]|uniref:Uncharacterized protein n=1 Tax=Zostera marina TaxID=29655 RepID=A0A0K9PI30_ZOSMR|nr:hypothetical protein ZOSMA_252G00060 [Zostera marina]
MSWVSDLKGGSFPPLESIQNLRYLILRNCSISGELPSYIGYMKSLKAIDVSFNNFTGEIPSSFINLNLTLDLMYLSDNKFTGQIPS